MAVSRTPIPTFLQRVRTLVYRHEARRATLYAVAAVAGIVLVLPLLGAVVGASRATALAVLALGGLIVVLLAVSAVVLGLVAPRRRWGGDPALARWVGGRRREIASDLLSAVELTSAPPRPGAPSRALVDALVEVTSARLDDIDPRSLIEPDELRRARRWAVAALALNLALVVTAPRMVADGWRSLVLARPAPFDGAQLSAVPLVGDLEATLTAPPYSRRPKLTLPSSSGDVRGLPGTRVALKARVLVPASSAELIVEPIDRGEARTIAAKLDGDQLTAALTIERSARYRFAIGSPSGERSIETATRAIEAEPDQAPAVQLMAPADPLDVTTLRRVELAYVIEDDFGITSAELVWESGKDKGRKPIALDGGRAAVTEPAIPGTPDAPAPRGRVQGKLMWDIAELQVPSGGEVRYWLEAKDNDTVGGPNIGRSRELHLKVVSPRERHEETLGRQQALAEKILKNLGGRLTPRRRAGGARGAGAPAARGGGRARHDRRRVREGPARVRRAAQGAVADARAARQAGDRRAAADAQGQAAGPAGVRRRSIRGWSASSRTTRSCSPTGSTASGWRACSTCPTRSPRTRSGSPTCSRSTSAPRTRACSTRSSARCTRSTARTPSSTGTAAAWPRTCSISTSTATRSQAQAGTSCIDEVRKLVRAGDAARGAAEARAVPPAAGALGVVARGLARHACAATSSATSRRSSTR